MKSRTIAAYIGYILLVEGLFMLPALGIAFAKGEHAAAYAFLGVMAGLILLGLLLRGKKEALSGMEAREGFLIVAIGWIAISLFGALPFYLSGAIPSLIDSIFEAVSGFTTTGASILSDVESLPKSILYWRSFSHWLGGMGVLVFMLALMPNTKGGGGPLHLMRAESTGPSVGKLTPTLRHTARILYIIYFCMTALEIVLLRLGGMTWFESLLNAFGTAGTGGFGIRNASIAAYDSVYLQFVIALFMMLFGVNFSMYYLLLRRQWGTAFKNEELRAYFLIVVVSTAAIAIAIAPQYQGNTGRALLDSYFQVSSILTTTGYSTVDFDKWPQVARVILLILMFIGGCAGSTGGGFKVARVLILGKSLRTQLHGLLRPRAVKPVRMDGKTLDESVVNNTAALLVAYLLLAVCTILLISLDGHSLETNSTAVLACLSNIGPGLADVGPTQNYGFYSGVSKCLLSLNMLFGRLEIFPLLLLFSTSTWRRKA